jgi:hypothetical protein
MRTSQPSHIPPPTKDVPVCAGHAVLAGLPTVPPWPDHRAPHPLTLPGLGSGRAVRRHVLACHCTRYVIATCFSGHIFVSVLTVEAMNIIYHENNRSKISPLECPSVGPSGTASALVHTCMYLGMNPHFSIPVCTLVCIHFVAVLREEDPSRGKVGKPKDISEGGGEGSN